MKVSTSHCPSLGFPGPEWYQIDIFTNSLASDGEELGELYALKNDVLLCNQRTVSHALVYVAMLCGRPSMGEHKVYSALVYHTMIRSSYQHHINFSSIRRDLCLPHVIQGLSISPQSMYGLLLQMLPRQTFASGNMHSHECVYKLEGTSYNNIIV